MRNFAAAAVLALAGSASATTVGFQKAKDAFECLKASHERSCQPSLGYAFDSPETCCYNGAIEAGGVENGLFLSTQFWNAQPSFGLPESTTVHGLWPDRCDGTYDAFCTAKTAIPEYTGAEIRAVLQKYDPKLLAFMDVNYKSNDGDDEGFWSHEWNKHGTCISTLRTQCQAPLFGISKEDFALVNYFRKIVDLFQDQPTYKWLKQAGITPSQTATYQLADMQAALAKKHGGTPYIGCNRNGEFTEVWYFWYVKGQVNFGKYIPTESTTKSSCPATVKYLPK